MEDMPTFKSRARCVFEPLDLADRAVVAALLAECQLRVEFDAVLVEAGHALGLALAAVAVVAAGEHLVAGLGHELDAFGGATNLAEGRLHRRRGLGQFREAVAALFGGLEVLVLRARLPQVVGLRAALSAEVLIALVATKPVLSHALSRLTGYGVAIFVLLVHIQFALHHLNDVAATAPDKAV